MLCPIVKGNDMLSSASRCGSICLLRERRLCRWGEMLYTIVVILLSIVMQAYILGTLNHYVVKKDAKLEAFR